MLAPSPAFSIRPASAADRAAQGDVVLRTWFSAYAHIFGARLIAGVFLGRVRMHVAWTGDCSERLGQWVASRGATVVGTAGLHMRRDGEAELDHLYVLEEHQGVGIGTALLATCCRELRGRRCPGLRIWVLERTPAVAFYRGNGAIPCGRATTNVGRQAEPTLCMRIGLAGPR